MADGATASGLRDDRNVCQLCGAFENLSLCTGCRETYYCCKDHQRADWKQHKRKCEKDRQSKPKQSPKQAVDTCNSTDTVSAQDSSECQSADSTLHSSRLAKSESNLESDLKLDVNTERRQIDKTAANTTGNKSTDLDSEVSTETAGVDVSKTKLQVLAAKQQQQQEQQSALKASKSRKKKKQQGSGGEKLSAIVEEGSGTNERYFLDNPFSQTLQSSKHTARARRSADAMSPKGSAPDTKDTYLDVLRSRFSAISKYVVHSLNRYDLCVIDGFLGKVTGQEILAEVKTLQDRGVMRKGQLVHSSSSVSDNIRGDIITWVDGREQNCENIQFLVSCMDAVIQNCATLLTGYTINERTKAMVACYPPNSTGYVRHVDNPNGDGRCITCIYYLNQDWDVRTDGGLLRIYPEGKDTLASVDPILDRLLFFWSDRRNPHEVLPSIKSRYAITVWYYDADERARALKRFKGELSKHPKKQAVPLFDSTTSDDS